MKILHTFETYNDYSGARTLRLLSEELVRRGHEVIVLSGGSGHHAELINGVTVHRFQIRGNSVRGIHGSSSDIANYQRHISESSADIVLNYAAQSWATDLVFPLLDKIKAKKVLVPCGYSRLKDPRYAGYFANLPRHLRQYDHLVYLSSRYTDKQFGDAEGLNEEGKYSIIPNCADETEFLAPNIINFRDKFNIQTTHLVLSVGNHAAAKNHLLLLRTIRHMRRPDITFALIGRLPGKLWRSCYAFCKLAGFGIPNLRVFDDLPREDVVAAFHGADAFLLTSRTECDPIVLYESFASKTPFIGTPAGSIPEFAAYVKIGSTSEELSSSLQDLLANQSARGALAEKAYQLWKEKYTLTKMADAYEALYERLLAGQSVMLSQKHSAKQP